MTVFGTWGAKPTVASWEAKLADGDAALDPAATLGTLIGDKERAYFIVHIPAAPPAAAAGASVLGWHDAHFLLSSWVQCYVL